MSDQIAALELQQELQRFATRFLDRVAQAIEVLEHAPEARVRDEALRKGLLYVSSVLEIATGPSTEVNLLDMFVFVRLSRRILETHWIPTLYGERATELRLAFARADDELTDIADRALGPARRAELETVVQTWVAENPDQIRIEGIRLADFSALAGTAAAGRALKASGLLSGVRVASDAANQAMLLAERAMFLLHRMPFLWRMQVRVGARELTSDVVVRAATGVPWAQLGRAVRRSAVVAGLFAVAGILVVRRRRR